MESWGKCSPELKELDEVVVGGGEVTTVEKSTGIDRGSGEGSRTNSSARGRIGAPTSAGRRRRGRGTRWPCWVRLQGAVATPSMVVRSGRFSDHGEIEQRREKG